MRPAITSSTENLTSVVLESTGDTGAVPPIRQDHPHRAWAMKRAAWYAIRAVQSTDSVNAYIRGRTVWSPLAAVFCLIPLIPAPVPETSTTLQQQQPCTAKRQRAAISIAGKMYDAKFAHVEGYDTCITCHDPHSLELKYDKCATCHTGATDTAALKNIRMKGSLEDYDGDGNLTEGMYYEVDGLKAKLYAAIQAYAAKVSLIKIVYNPASAIPTGLLMPMAMALQILLKQRTYNAYTARLVKATYNYQVSNKDPGSYAHNGKYIIELLYDSIEDLNAKLSTLVPSAAVDIVCLRAGKMKATSTVLLKPGGTGM